MSDTIQGTVAPKQDMQFESVGDPSFYEENGESQQLYLDSVLPQSYDPTLEPYNTRSLNPKKYMQQTVEGFHPIPKNPYEYSFSNANPYFDPQNAALINFT